MNKNTKIIWGIVMAVIVIVGGYFSFIHVLTGGPDYGRTGPVDRPAADTVVDSNWKTYSGYGIEFKYPSDAVVVTDCTGTPCQVLVSYHSSSTDAIQGIDYNKKVQIQLYWKGQGTYYEEAAARKTATDSMYKSDKMAVHVFILEKGDIKLFEIVGSTFKFVNPKNNDKIVGVFLGSDWITHTDSQYGITFQYPSLISMVQDGESITLSHSVSYKHPDPCDFKGDAPSLDKLSDLKVSFKVVNQNLKDFVQSSTYPGWDYVSKNPFKSGSVSGFKVSSGIEGCGEYIYYLTISPTKTLVIHRGYIAEFNSINGNYQKYLSLPGIVTPNQEEEIFTKIISSLNFTK